ncbi:hypothetical protein [Conexibacter sp. CPCC 206217]|uniref:hypothetical protein n=1 Tax=Conexibacter sp. CPCC 206217 TaxID=3064574 RepID=UPI002727AA6E|nr:hypothetical protein [Conexibacter sp. CPCC 206217]MDO8209668.1 hypothetical protein [Conexibacter sp. CPCC 206217]
MPAGVWSFSASACWWWSHGVTISPSERGVLRDLIVARIASVGELAAVIEAGRLREARELGRCWREDLHLLEDLGWGANDPGREFTFAREWGPHRRALARLYEHALGVVIDSPHPTGKGGLEVEAASVAMRVADEILIELTEIEDDDAGGGS